LRDSGGRGELPRLHSGSWIDSDFHIWIGDPIKNRAWNLLGRVRRRVERARSQKTPAANFERAFESILAAEGSDWFWWFGEPFHSTEDAIFDRLFRLHLAGALTALGEPIDEELERPVDPQIGGTPRARGTLTPPYALIRPRIESGRSPSFYEWHGAGRFEVPRGAAMAEKPLVERVHFGFDRERLYLRLDVDPERAATLEGELACELTTGGRRLRLRLRLPAPDGWTLEETDADGGWRALASGGPATAARGAILLAAPFARLGLAPGAKAGLVIRLAQGAAALLRQPQDGAIELVLPDDKFEAENWSA
jgi:hypothetical protein